MQECKLTENATFQHRPGGRIIRIALSGLCALIVVLRSIYLVLVSVHSHFLSDPLFTCSLASSLYRFLIPSLRLSCCLSVSFSYRCAVLPSYCYSLAHILVTLPSCSGTIPLSYFPVVSTVLPCAPAAWTLVAFSYSRLPILSPYDLPLGSRVL